MMLFLQSMKQYWKTRTYEDSQLLEETIKVVQEQIESMNKDVPINLNDNLKDKFRIKYKQ